MKNIKTAALILVLVICSSVIAEAAAPVFIREFQMNIEFPEGWHYYVPGLNAPDEIFLAGSNPQDFEKYCKKNKIALVGAAEDKSCQLVLFTKGASHDDLTLIEDSDIPYVMQKVYGTKDMESVIEELTTDIVMISGQKFYFISGKTESAGETIETSCYVTVNNGQVLVFRFTGIPGNASLDDIDKIASSLTFTDIKVTNRATRFSIAFASLCFLTAIYLRRRAAGKKG